MEINCVFSREKPIFTKGIVKRSSGIKTLDSCSFQALGVKGKRLPLDYCCLCLCRLKYISGYCQYASGSQPSFFLCIMGSMIQVKYWQGPEKKRLEETRSLGPGKWAVEVMDITSGLPEGYVKL